METMISGPPSPGGMEMMMGGGMEHPVNTMFVPALINPRLLMQFSTAVETYAGTVGRRSEAEARIGELKARLKNFNCPDTSGGTVTAF